jgi:toxin CcdB
MAQFDVHRLGQGFVIDCQTGLLDQLASRFVVPLIPRAEAQHVARRLNPVFEIDGAEYVMLTQAAAAVRCTELGAVVSSLADRSIEITGALDVLISGV